jgi:hypothetical protein
LPVTALDGCDLEPCGQGESQGGLNEGGLNKAV